MQGPHQPARRSLQPPVEECAIAFARSRAGELRQPHRLRRKITRSVHRRMRRRFREGARHDQPVLQETAVGVLVPTRELVRTRPPCGSHTPAAASFNPRAREGSTSSMRKSIPASLVSTREPVRARREASPRVSHAVVVSTRKPVRARLCRRVALAEQPVVSTREPVRARRRSASQGIRASWCFNPRAREGSTRCVLQRSRSALVSTREPVRARPSRRSSNSRFIEFQPASP